MADVTLESTEEIIQLVSVSGASTADITAAVAVETAARQAADAAHAILTTGIHGVGVSTIASAASVSSAVSTHAALTTGVHGVADTSALDTVTARNAAIAAHDISGAAHADIRALVTGGDIGIAGGDYRVIACVLYSDSGTWKMYNNTDHAPVNVTGITQDGAKITVTYSITGAKVISSAVTPDETYAGKYIFGASVGVSFLDIYCFRASRHEHSTWLCTKIGTDPFFSVSNFAGAAMAPAAIVWTAGELAITHNAAEATTLEGNMLADPMGYEVYIQTSRNTADYSHTYLKFYTLAGVQITDPSNFPSGFRFMFEKATTSKIYAQLNPNVPELQLASSNIWVIAVVKMT